VHYPLERRVVASRTGTTLIPTSSVATSSTKLTELHDELAGPWRARGRTRWPTPYLYGGD